MSTLTRPKRPAPASGGLRRRAVGVLLVGAVVSAGVAVGIGISASPGAPEALPASDAASAETAVPVADWATLVADLDVARDLALRSGNPAAIANYAAPNSPAASADEQLLEQVRSSSLRPSLVLPEVSDVEAIAVGADEALLRVQDRLAEVSWIGADGVAAATQDAREARSWLLTLRSVDERWLLWEVSAEVDEAR